MKTLSLIFIFILSISFAFAQSNVQPNQTWEKWQTVSPEGEEFSVEVPGLLMPGLINFAAANSTGNRSYRTVSGNNYYFVFSDPPKNSSQNNFVFDFAGRLADSNQENTIFKFTDKFGFYNRILTVKTLNRIYTFQTVSRDKNSPQVDRFFAGIKVGFKAPEIKESAASDKQIEPLPDKKEIQPSGIGSGNGSGNGSGSGNGMGANESKPSITSQTSPIKILSKPRPSYTEYARFYEITGTVRVRVTFLASGKVGSVTPTIVLPFGLTEEAIEAAKGIEFEPATKDGQPITLVKQVEYNFLLY